MLKENFNTRYQHNRVPLALWLYKGWLDHQANVDGLNKFLTWARQYEEVWIVPVGKMMDSVNYPLPLSDPVLKALLHVQTYTAVPEAEALLNSYNKTFRTVGVYAPGDISPDTLFWETREVASSLTARIVITSDWGSGFQGDVVVDHPGTGGISD